MNFNDEQFIENENGWPNWPVLFIKKPNQSGGPETGFIYGSSDRKEGEPHKTYLNCNLYIKESWKGKEPVMMTSKEIVDSGWVVD